MRSRPTVIAAAMLLAGVSLAPPAAAGVGPAAPRWDPKNTYALVVGIVQWKNKQFASFPTANRQDRELYRAILDAGVPRANTVLLIDREATYDAITDAWAQLATRAGEGSTLLFYFTGHGGASSGEIYLCDYDAKPDCIGSSVNVEEIGNILRKKKWAGERLILMSDMCHSGGMARIVRSFEDHPRIKAALLASATYSNISTGNWTFTEALVAAFRGQPAVDMNRDGHITFADVDDYASREMKFRELQLSRAARTPSFEGVRFTLRDVDGEPLPTLPGNWQIGDYPDVKGPRRWLPAHITGFDKGKYQVEFLTAVERPDSGVPLERLRARPGGWGREGQHVEVLLEKKWHKARVERIDDDFFYFVKYDDLSVAWNEWVTADRMRPLK
jgi:hypothetical protein